MSSTIALVWYPEREFPEGRGGATVLGVQEGPNKGKEPPSQCLSARKHSTSAEGPLCILGEVLMSTYVRSFLKLGKQIALPTKTR